MNFSGIITNLPGGPYAWNMALWLIALTAFVAWLAGSAFVTVYQETDKYFWANDSSALKRLVLNRWRWAGFSWAMIAATYCAGAVIFVQGAEAKSVMMDSAPQDVIIFPTFLFGLVALGCYAFHRLGQPNRQMA